MTASRTEVVGQRLACHAVGRAGTLTPTMWLQYTACVGTAMGRVSFSLGTALLGALLVCRPAWQRWAVLLAYAGLGLALRWCPES